MMLLHAFTQRLPWAPATALATLTLSCACATAASTTFYGLDNGVGPSGLHPNSDVARAALLSNLWPGSVGTQDFDGLATGSFLGGTISFGFPPLPTTATVNDLSSGGGPAEIHSGLIRSVFPVSGSQFLFTGTVGNTTYLSLTFSTPQTGIGLYLVALSNYFGAPGSYTPVQISFDGGAPINLFNVAPTSIRDESVSYFGFIADIPFSSIRLINPQGTLPDEGGLDSITIGRNLALPAVPEPSSGLMLLLGITCLFTTRAILRDA